MKKYLVIVGFICGGDIFASQENRNLISESRRYMGVNVCTTLSDNTSDLDWVSHYKNNSQSFLSILNEYPGLGLNPKDAYDLYEVLQKKVSGVKGATFSRDYKRLLGEYLLEIREFEKEHSCLPAEAVGYAATVVATIGGGILGQLAAWAIYTNCEMKSTPQEKWDGTCGSFFLPETFGLMTVGTVPTVLCGVALIEWRRKKTLKKNLLECGNAHLIAVYEILKKVPGKHYKIHW